MSEHTSGPWIIQSDPCHYDTLSIVVANERMIVHVGGCCEPAEQEANTRLIAAAPDLLRFAEDFVRAWKDGKSDRAHLMRKAMEAIVKANGDV